jgi:hypothetical protein
VKSSQTSELRATDRGIKAALLREAEVISSLIDETFAYIDTVQVLIDPELQDDELIALQRLSDKRIEKGKSRVPGYYYYRLQRISLEAIDHIRRNFPDHIVNRVDLGIDLTALSEPIAAEIQAFLNRHLTQPRSGNRRVSLYENTQYYSRTKWLRRNIALYSRKSKITRNPAAHFDLRYFGVRTCRMRGVSTLADLIDFNPDTAIKRDSRLSSINWRKGDRLVDAVATKIMRRQADREKQALSARRRVRPYERRIDRNLARARVVHHLLRSLGSDTDDIPPWTERYEFSVPFCLFWIPTLRAATVHVPMSTLVKPPLSLIWP